MLQIILVDDNRADCVLFQTAVEEASLPVEIICLSDGLKALEYLNGDLSVKRPLVLIDLDLPKMGGLEVLAKIRSEADLASIPVVVLAGSNQPSVIAQCYEAGANSFMSKPDSWDKFVAATTKLVQYWSTVALPRNPRRPLASLNLRSVGKEGLD